MSRAPERGLLELLSGYAPQISGLALAARDMVLEEAPEACECYARGYAVSIMFSFTGKPIKDGFCHVVAYATHVNLGFNRGATLADPQKILSGSGKQIRHVKLGSEEDLERPAIRRLVRLAIEQARRTGESVTMSGGRRPAS